MKKIFFVILSLIATSAHAIDPAFEIAKYPAWIKNQCLELTATKTRVSYNYNWDEALDCAVRSWEKYQRDRLLESQINANDAQAELDRQLTKELKKR